MSLIERALEKTRALGAKPPASANVRPQVPATELPYVPPQPVTGRVVRPMPTRRLTIDMERLRYEGMIPPAEAQRRLSMQVRSIKNKLLQAVRAGGAVRDRIIMVTSALAGDGKTFNSVSIALSLATEKDFHVLLVDGDIPKPSVGNLFGIHEAPGLLDAAREPTLDPEQLVIGTDLPGLDLLSAGRSGVDSAESMSSSRMRDIIDRLATVPNRIVLLDSAPLLLTSEAAVLAQYAGQVLLVVREAVTPQQAVLDALAMLGERQGIAMILNGVSESKLEQAYYGYDPYYGYGEEQGASDA